MDSQELIKRKIHLKRQGLKLTKGDILKLQEQLILIRMKDSLESQTSGNSDPILSQKLDCVIFLLEN